MKYYLSTEFHEKLCKPIFGKKRHYIDLISIGIVCEDGRSYYAIRSDFDVKAAWNTYQIDKTSKLDLPGVNRSTKKVYWLRENILKPIFYELNGKDINLHDIDRWFTLSNFIIILQDYGKSKKRIGEEIIEFVYADIFNNFKGSEKEFHLRTKEYGWNTDSPIEFYGYECEYDWVLFSSLFGDKNDLPIGFPKYCYNLKQTLDEKVTKWRDERIKNETKKINFASWEEYLLSVKCHPNYPQEPDGYDSLAHAKWNKDLFNFLKNTPYLKTSSD